MLKVKEICEAQGITLQVLAKKLGITYQSLWSQLSGNPTLSKLQDIANALGVDVTDLFERKSDFIAFVRHNGITQTFESETALKEFAARL